MNDARRGNYDSGEDFVLEYGELRFTFNERDFRERCEQAANKLGFVSGRLDDPELEDLVTLSVNGEIQEPASALGEHVNDCWPELVGPSDRSLVHWLRRLVFRSAWLDQRVKENELDVEFDEESSTFMYVQHSLYEASFLGPRVLVRTSTPCLVQEIVAVTLPPYRTRAVLESPERERKSTRRNTSHPQQTLMPSSS